MGRPLRVLVIEDVPDDAELMLRELRRAGYDPTAERVESDAAMRAALAAGPWDAVLSDNSLPRFSAAAALKLLGELALDIPFIIVSGSIGEETAVALMKAGAHDYVLKGNLTRLAAAVERELREAEGRRQRRRAEQALWAQREFLQQVIDADPNLVFVKDWDGKFTLVNKAVADIYGTAADALVGKTDADFNPGQAEVEHFLRDDREVMITLRRKLIPEEPVTNPSTGETRWFQTVKVPVVSPDGTARYVLGVATDITERKRLEEQFRQAQKMEAIGQLAGGVAHDFNNIITAIMGYADLLQQDLPPSSSLRQDVEEIRRAAERAGGLTRQLLAFSRRQILAPQVLDLNALVADMDKLLRRLLGEDVDLVTTLDPALGRVRADPGQLEQVIVNLAVNARDAMPDGGKLTIETKNAELDEAYTHTHLPVIPGRYVMLAVSDTGAGMDAETQARMFEPFFTTKEKGKGTGLGLATVYGIVKQSEGYIWCYTELGHGTTFKVYLPLVEEAAEQVARRPAGKPARGSETVLLVEDEEPVRTVARRVLEAHGYTVLEATKGEEALAQAREHSGPVHLLMTDVVLPGVSGRKLADELVALRPDIKVLYMSGYTEDAIVHRGVLEPHIAFVHKPFTPDALARKVREVLDGT